LDVIHCASRRITTHQLNVIYRRTVRFSGRHMGATDRQSGRSLAGTIVMVKLTAFTLVAALVTFPVIAQEAPPRGWASGIPQAECTAAKGLKWREADTITSAATGKVRQVKAGCMVDPKAARAVLYGLQKR